MSLVISNLSISIAYRVFKKAVDLTRPTPERQDVPLHGGGRSKVRDAKNNDVTFADEREVHVAPNKTRHVCERPRDGARALSRERPMSQTTRERRWGLFQHPVRC